MITEEHKWAGEIQLSLFIFALRIGCTRVGGPVDARFSRRVVCFFGLFSSVSFLIVGEVSTAKIPLKEKMDRNPSRELTNLLTFFALYQTLLRSACIPCFLLVILLWANFVYNVRLCRRIYLQNARIRGLSVTSRSLA